MTDYAQPHVCNYASRYRPSLCQRMVTDGHRYCWSHRPGRLEKDMTRGLIHTVTYTFAFDGGYNGLFIPHGKNIHSVCSHSHATTDAAIRCAQAKRAAYNKEGWQPL